MTVVLAFLANILVAIAKSVAAVLSGSASMLAEAVHSWADAGNEIFLLLADRRGSRRRDAARPLGYGREAYVWSLFAAIGVFAAGSALSIFHGIQELSADEPSSAYLLSYIVLGASAVLEGSSFLQAVIRVRRTARERDRDALEFVFNTSNTTLRAVIAEDGAALVSLVIAAAGIVLHQVTGHAFWDALGSIAVGTLLGVVAITLMQRNIRFLVGASAPDASRSAAGKALLESPLVDRVTYLHLEVTGPDRVLLVASVDLTGNDDEEDVAVRLQEMEERLEKLPFVETAVLSLSTPDERSLTF